MANVTFGQLLDGQKLDLHNYSQNPAGLAPSPITSHLAHWWSICITGLVVETRGMVQAQDEAFEAGQTTSR